MVERTGGLGGFGGITSDRTDQRTWRYHPHKAVVKREDYLENVVHVRCLHCKAEWTHGRGDPWGSGPEECER